MLAHETELAAVQIVSGMDCSVVVMAAAKLCRTGLVVDIAAVGQIDAGSKIVQVVCRKD